MALLSRHLISTLILGLASTALADDSLKPWASNTDPSDVPKSHVELITQADHGYTVVQGGTMDGRNCRSPMGCGMSREGAMLQTWESNRSVRMENVGETDVINPWLSNGRNNFRSVREIVAVAIVPGMTDGEKAYALWFQEIQHRHHDPGDNNELGDPVKLFNVYGYNTCGNDSLSMGALLHQVGLRSAPARALGHCISQAFYDSGWHFFDGDMHSVYLLRDNKTVAGEEDLVRDHDLVKRTHSQGILFPDGWRPDAELASLYCFEGPVGGDRSRTVDTTMNMVLRPGESIVWRWGQTSPVKYHGAPGSDPVYKNLIYDGLWEYRPDLSKETWRKGTISADNVVSSADGLAAAEGKTATIIWTMRSPYVFVGARLEAEGSGAEFSISKDGKTWQAAAGDLDMIIPTHAPARPQRPSPSDVQPNSDRQRDLDKFFPTIGPASYQYQIKCQLEGTARLHRLAIRNDVQMAPLAMPEMAVGENAFTYTDNSGGERNVRITHQWVERSASKPPASPPAAVYPPAGGQADGTDFAFRWTAPADPNGAAIADYHFELSGRPDMKTPLSMSFYKLISRTADGGSGTSTVKPQYTLPEAGLLTPGTRYYWHVRAQNSKGVWGPWSSTWSFTPRGTAWPLAVTVDYDQAKGIGVLHWKPNPLGTVPAKYRVYGSDERGFSIADEKHQGVVGVTKQEMAAWDPSFPANFIAETTAAELPVLGSGVDLPAANKTYYRVVAVDEQGRRSGASDPAEAPRPIIYSRPVLAATVGAPYQCQIQATRSLGDLSARMAGNNQVSGYFDIEKPTFTLTKGPTWLTIDPATGILSGTPDAEGNAEVVVTTALDRQSRKLDENALVWGSEKVLSISTERIGTANQSFTIEVQKAN